MDSAAIERPVTRMDRTTNSRFNYLAKLFRSQNRIALRDALEGKLTGPLVVDFDPTTACNFSCPECISADLLNMKRIETDRIVSLMYEFANAGVQGVVFIGGGEPLAHTSMPKPIRLAHDLGMACGLTTNGSLINRYVDTLAECCHWTRVSMDAGTSETFLTFRPNKIKNSFSIVVDGMAALARQKVGALGYSFVLIQRLDGATMVSNAHEIYTAARLAKEIGCDYFELKPMLDMHHSLISFKGRTADIVRDQLSRAYGLCDHSFDVVTTASMLHMEKNARESQQKDYHSCPTMELRTTVTPSGIYPCAYHRGRKDLQIGNVDDGPFDQFWLSGARKRAAAKVDPAQHCSFYCARHNINRVMLSLAELKRDGISLLDYIAEFDVDDVFL